MYMNNDYCQVLLFCTHQRIDLHKNVLCRNRGVGRLFILTFEMGNEGGASWRDINIIIVVR